MNSHFTNLPLRFATALCLLLLAAAHPTFGAVTFTGDTSNSTNVVVGNTGQGNLTIDDGSSLSNTEGYLGFSTGSNGTVNVNGGNWTNSSALYIGSSGTGSLTISSGNISNTNGIVGNSVGSNGTVNMSGGNWTNSSALYIGRSGTGSLTITNGTISNTYGTVGDDAGSNGTVTVSGGNWTNNDLFIGNRGTGSLTISGGIVTTTSGTLGREGTGSNGTVNVSGGTWVNSGSLSVGRSGTGSLTISSGTVSNTSSEVGFRQFSFIPSGTGTVNVSGGAWTNSGSLSVGKGGNGSLTISGGIVTNTDGEVGSSEGPSFLIARGTGTVNVSGGAWTNSGNLSVGKGGNGSLTISGGTVTNTNGYIGLNASSNGTVNVSGGTWSSSSNLAVGVSGTGSLTINGTGTVIVGDTLSRGSNGTINLENGGTLQIGTGGATGTLATDLTNNGTLIFDRSSDSTCSFEISGTGSLTKNGSGTLTLSGNNTYSGGTTLAGGTLSLGSSQALGTEGTISFSGGSLQFTAYNTTDYAARFSQDVNQAYAIDTSDEYITLFSALTSDGGSLTKQGAGILVLTGTNTYTGNTSIISGTLVVSENSSLADSTNVSVATGATYQVDATDTIGSIAGNGTIILNGYSLTAGGSNSTTTFSGMMRDEPGYPGSFTKAGTGTLTLSGNNTYTGGTTLAGGTLSLGSNEAVGTEGTLSFSGGSLQFTANNTTDYSARFSQDVNQAYAIDTNGQNITLANVLTSAGGSLTKQGTGTLTLTGNNTYTGSTTIDAGALQIGNGSDSASISQSSIGYLGFDSGSNGTATVSTGGTWTTTGDLFVGYAGNGHLTVSGGTVSNVNGVIGAMAGDVDNNIAGSNGSVTISGGNWTNSGTLTIGDQGTGSLTVSGGNVSNVNGVIGYESSATISGGNWTNSGNLYIAANANSTLTITGGLVTVAGTLTKMPAGKINLNAGGTLSIGAGGTTGELNTNGAFTYNGTLIFNRTAGYTYSSNLGGSGSLIKQGSNALILTGTNTYTGTTTISSGTLQIGNSALTGSISSSSNIINNANLDFKSSNNQTYGGQISGSGALNKRQGGTLILSGNNTYTGDTTIHAGTLQIGDGGASGSLVSNVSGGPLVFNRSDSSTYGGVFSGSTLTKLGAGALTLTGNNTYTGSTTISAGTLQIGAGGTTGAITSNIINNAALVFNRSDASTYSGSISGTGAVTKSGAGTLTLASTNTYSGSTTISAGTLQLGNGGTSGSVTGNITNNAALVFNRSDSSTYSGSITGTGTLQKLGTGTTTLNGSNTYAGGTTVSAGTLVLASGGSISHSGAAFYLAGAGESAAVILNGGSISNFDGYIGFGNGSTGTVNMNSGNWTNGENLRVGYYGNGTLNLTGGSISNVNGVIGRYGDSNGVANVSGGTWSSSGNLRIGQEATGTLNLTGGNVVVASGSGNVTIGQETGSSGTLNIGTGTTVGTLQAARVTGGNGTAVVNFNHSGNETFSPILAGSLAVNKLGSGTTTLSGNNTYTGATAINAGELLVNGNLASSATTVNSGGTLGGIGTLGAVTINSGGTIAPGNSPGTITVGNSVWNGGGIYNWELGNANGTTGMDWDLISSSGTLTIGANATNKFTIRLASYGSGSLSGVKSASWEIGNFTTGITGFSNDYFTFNATGMSGSAGSYSLSLGGGNTTLLLNYASAGSVWSTGSGNWATATQWQGNTLPTNGDAIEFSGPGGTSTNNFASSNLSEISGVTFTSTANGSYTINGNALTIGADGIVNNSNSTQTVAINLTLGANQTFASNTANLVISGNISGNASFTKAGNETLTLTGNNTYSGGTIVSAGMLAGTTSSLQGAITNNSVVNFDQMTSGTYAGAMSGNGSLLKTGSGTVTISGTNSYTGGTQLDGGVLEALHTNALGNGALTLSSGTLAVGNTANPNLVLSGMTDLVWLSSNAAISLAHGGNITISGNFSNGGNTGNRTLDFGTGQSLQLGNNTLVSFGATNFSASNFVAAISGSNSLSGSFQIIGNSLVYNLQGANVSGNVIDNSGAGATPIWVDFTVNGNTGNGTVITAGGNNTIRDLAFTNNGNLAIQAGYSLTLSQGQVAVENGSSVVNGGTLATPGNFNKTGAGELDVQSTLSVNGTASIDAGLLSVNGNLTANSVAVNSGAILGGSGTIFAPVTVSGTLAPGNSPGTLSMASLALTPTAVTDIEIESLTNFDRLVIGGAATVDGTLNVIPYNGNPLAYGQQYSFLAAGGGISGEFDTITAPATFRGRFLNLGTTGILLIAPDSYTQVAVTPNQQNVVKALDSFIAATSGDRETVSIALDLQTAEQYPAAFDQIMPGFYESLANIAIEQAFNQTQMLNQRISSVRLGAAGFQAIGGISQPLVHDKNGKSAADAKDASPIVESATATNWNAWALGTGMFSRSTNLGSLQNYNNDAGGFLVGADYRWSENFVTGLYGGYDYSYAEYNGGGSTKGNSFNFGTYASYAKDGYYADAVIGGGYTGFQTKRSIEFSTIDRTASADPNSGQFTAGLNLGKDFEVGKFTLGPIVGAQYTYAGIGSFTESGAESLDLSLGQQNANSLRSTLGGRIAYTWNLNQKIALIPEVRMFWQHEFLNNARNINASLDGGNGASFDYETTDPYRNSVFAGAGVTAQFGKNLSGSVFYNINFGSQTYQNNMVSAGLNFSF